ncbi:MAG: hypothetical protein WC657_02930 [Candidatus Paceibacterota bacterium]|jgi:hypothetical protein
MEELSQQTQIEIGDEKYKKYTAYLENIFYNKDKPEELEKFYSEIRDLANVAGLDSGILIEKFKLSLDLNSLEDFVSSAFEILKDIINLNINHPEIFERMRRERIMQAKGNIRLSELVYYDVDLEHGVARIHIAPGKDINPILILRSFREGLKKLAKELEEDERIKEIKADSWIVASNPGLLEKAGFVIDGPITDEERERYFSGDPRPISKSHINRETFLEKYLN